MVAIVESFKDEDDDCTWHVASLDRLIESEGDFRTQAMEEGALYGAASGALALVNLRETA